MSFFDFSISKVADTLMSQSAMFNCSLEEAWNDYTHPLLTKSIAFEDVKNYIDEQIALGEKYDSN